MHFTRKAKLLRVLTATLDSAPPVSIVRTPSGYAASWEIPRYNVDIRVETPNGESQVFKLNLVTDETIRKNFKGKKYVVESQFPTTPLQYGASFAFGTDAKLHVPELYVEFKNLNTNSYMLTNTGSSLSVFGAVIQACRKILEAHPQIRIITFSASGSNRQKLYSTFARKFLPEFKVININGNFSLVHPDLTVNEDLYAKNVSTPKGVIYIDPNTLSVKNGRLHGNQSSTTRNGIAVPVEHAVPINPMSWLDSEYDITSWAQTKEGQAVIVNIDAQLEQLHEQSLTVRDSPMKDITDTNNLFAEVYQELINEYGEVYNQNMQYFESSYSEPVEPEEPDSDQELVSSADEFIRKVKPLVEKAQELLEDEQEDHDDDLLTLAEKIRQIFDNMSILPLTDIIESDNDSAANFLSLIDDDEAYENFPAFVKYFSEDLVDKIEEMHQEWSDYEYNLSEYNDAEREFERDRSRAEDADESADHYYQLVLEALLKQQVSEELFDALNSFEDEITERLPPKTTALFKELAQYF